MIFVIQDAEALLETGPCLIITWVDQTSLNSLSYIDRPK